MTLVFRSNVPADPSVVTGASFKVSSGLLGAYRFNSATPAQALVNLANPSKPLVAEGTGQVFEADGVTLKGGTGFLNTQIAEAINMTLFVKASSLEAALTSPNRVPLLGNFGSGGVSMWLENASTDPAPAGRIRGAAGVNPTAPAFTSSPNVSAANVTDTGAFHIYALRVTDGGLLEIFCDGVRLTSIALTAARYLTAPMMLLGSFPTSTQYQGRAKYRKALIYGRALVDAEMADMLPWMA